MKLFTVLIFFALLSLRTEAYPSLKERNDTKCLVQHFKSLKSFDDNYPEDGVSVEPEYCRQLFGQTRKDLIEFFISTLAEGASSLTLHHIVCFADELTSSYRAETLLKEIYKASEDLSQEEKVSRIAKSDERILTMTTDAFQKCYFEKLYQEMLIQALNDIDDVEKDYCVRKHLIANGLLDANVHNVTDDPNCKPILVKLYNENFTTFTKLNNVGNMTEMELQCAMAKYSERKYIEHLLIASVMDWTQMSEEKRAAEEVRFIKTMAGYHPDMSYCQGGSNYCDFSLPLCKDLLALAQKLTA